MNAVQPRIDMKKQFGFSLLEAMVAVAIIAILAAMAIPSYLFKITREQIEASIQLTVETAQPAVAASWKTTQTFPADNTQAGLPSADRIVNNFVRSVAIEDGAIHITFGNRANGRLKDKVLTLRPAVIEDAPMVPITWVCGSGDAPEKMVIKGADRTTLPKEMLPIVCKPRPK